MKELPFCTKCRKSGKVVLIGDWNVFLCRKCLKGEIRDANKELSFAKSEVIFRNGILKTYTNAMEHAGWHNTKEYS